ncbi:hypothetical protein EVAR_58101_1 [Eumeta japonica]|uniref:Uncharacterized protein n=1 Tax=Eumeta variegata TaxID=151549 RepID=A0A4C1YQE8_EUMVA|nr:hypothetical protein EVAR_58101_1 [Eumeta japonica]
MVEKQIRGSAVGCMLHVNACCRQAPVMDFRELTPQTIESRYFVIQCRDQFDNDNAVKRRMTREAGGVFSADAAACVRPPGGSVGGRRGGVGSRRGGGAVINARNLRRTLKNFKNSSPPCENYSVLSRFDGPGCGSASDRVSELNTSGRTGEGSNVMELSELINENDFDDEPPTLTPLPSPVLPLVFNSETRSDAEPQPGPSKRLRTE